MTNQAIVDRIEECLPKLPADIREKLLDAVYTVLDDNRDETEENYG